MAISRFPYTNLHELNLDWIIEQLNKEGAVTSVNNKHGIVVLTGVDILRDPTSDETIAQALTIQGTSIQTARNQIGTTPLPTTAQTLTGAIAEQESDITGITNKIGNTQLPTTAQTLTGAIAEQESDLTTISNQLPKKANVQYKGIQGNSSETFNITIGSFIILGRQSISLYALYVVDLVGSILLVAGNNTSATLSISNDVLTVQNNTAAGFSCTVISP